MQGKEEGNLAEDIKNAKKLLDKLVGGTLDIDNFFLIRNATTIQEIFCEAIFCNDNVHSFAKAKMLDDVTHIVSKSSRNRYVCCNWGLLDLLLELIPKIKNEILFDKILKLVSVLGTHSVSIANVKQCLRTLTVTATTSAPFDMYHAKLLATYDTMTNKQGPNEFFDFDGDNSGIKISPIEKWPNSYSISMWVCVESFDHIDKTKNQFYEPRLFCFLSSRGDGVEAYFLRDSLCIRTNGSHKVQLKKYRFSVNRWHHVCIVHTYQWWVLGNSSVQIYVNGTLLEQIGLKYPNTNNAFTMCYLGTSPSVDTAFMYVPKDCTLCGTLGPTMLFANAITQQQVDDLHKAGPNALIVPHHKDSSYYQGFPRLIFSFSPKGSSGGLCQDLGHSFENEVYCSAQTMGTTFVQQTLGWNDSLFCAGGIQLLLPLFHQYGQFPDKVKYSLGSLFLFLAHSLESVQNQHEFHQHQGFSVIGLLLESVEPSVISNEVVGALDTLMSTVARHDKLQLEGFQYLVTNMQVWRRAPVEVQMLHFGYVQTRIARSPAYFRDFFGVRRILDNLREYYSFSEDPSMHETTRKLREELIKIIKIFIKSSKNELNADFKAIAGYLQDCTQTQAMQDVLHLLLSLAVKYGKQYISHIEQSGGYATFLNLMGRDMEEVRILSIKLIGCLLKDGNNKARGKFMHFYGTQYIVEILKHYPFTEATYRALTEVLVGRISLEPTSIHGLLEMIGTTGNFANPQFVETILVLTSMTDITMMQKIMSDISVCLRHNPSVCDAVTSLPSWHEFIFTLLYAAISGTPEDIFDPNSKFDDPPLVSPHFASTPVASAAALATNAATTIASALATAITLIPTPNAQQPPPATTITTTTTTTTHTTASATTTLTTSTSSITSGTSMSPVASPVSSPVASPVLQASAAFTPSPTIPALPSSRSHKLSLLHSSGITTRRPPTVSLQTTNPQSFGVTHRALTVPLHSGNPLVSSHYSPFISHPSRLKQVETVIELILDTTNVLLHQCLFKKDGWKIVEEVLSVMYACTLYFDDMVKLERKILYDVLENLLEELRRVDSTRHTALVKNAVNIGCLVDDFIYNSENLLAHRTPDGHWEDFSLVMKFLQVFDITLKHHQQLYQQQQQLQPSLQTSPVLNPPLKHSGDHPKRLVSSVSFPQPGSYPGNLAQPPSSGPSPLRNSTFSSLQQLQKPSLVQSLSEYPPVEMYKGKSFANILYRISLLVFQESLDLFVKNETTTVQNIWSLPPVPPLDQLLEKNIARVRIMLSIGIFGIGSKDHKEEVKRVLALIQHLVKTISRARKMNIPHMEGTILLLRDILRVSARLIDQSCSVEEDWRIVESPPAFAESVGATEFMEYFDKGLLLNFPFLNKMKTAAAEFDKEERPSPTQVAGRRQKSLDSARLALLKERDAMRAKVHKFQTDVYGLIQKQNVAESTHKLTRARFYYFHRSNIEKKWKKIHKMVTISNLLAPSANAKQEKIFWRLSPYENGRRMRKMMAPHLTGTDHSEHSLEYENSIMETSTLNEAPEEKQDSEVDNESNDDWIFLDQPTTNTPSQATSSPNIHSDSVTSSSDTTRHHIHIHPEFYQDISCVHSWACEMLLGITVFKGRLCVTKQVLFFTPDFEVASAAAEGLSLKPKNKAWMLNTVISCRSRKYLLLDTAVELFFENRLSRFFIFEDMEAQKQVMKFILTAVPSAAYDGQEALKIATQKWKKREITNFEYLIQLNTIAGRTYNDLNQYFVFPWIIMDYTSNKLDLTDFTIYRDLSKPVGALNDSRLHLFLERWQQCPAEIPPFHYGTHYSNAGAVLFYLMRIEPFTELFVMLQGGKFDIADRMFTSMADTLRNCLNSTSDVKELIPEFYYFPEFMENLNHIDFGMRQNGEPVDEVTLPPWASTSQEFVDICRKALESEFVSQNIHHWIDLIFGFKQRGKAAEEAANVFYHLTYAGSVDVNTLADPILREATRVQLNNFGVTPTQLFKEPHPRRDHTPEKINTVFTKFSALRNSGDQLINFQSSSAMFYAGDRVVVFGAFGEVTSKKLVNGNIMDVVTGTVSFSANLRLQIGKPYVMFPNNPKMVIATGKWENQLIVVNGEKVTSSVNLWCHKKPISVLALTEDGDKLVTGSFDGTMAVHSIRNEELVSHPDFLLRGHDNEITCLAVNADLDVCISGSTDKTVMIHSLRKGVLLRCVPHPEHKAIHQIALSANSGKFVVYSYERLPQDSEEQYNNLYLYSPTGTLLHSAHNTFYVSTMLVSPDGEYFILAGENYLCLRSFSTLAFMHKVEISRSWVIASFCVSPDARYLWVVGENVEMDKCCVFLFTIDKPMLEPITGSSMQPY
eukprot:Phypoly_transcript_00081.p1 GENE.Phypoly_transcript_00081~~Phypoly_transcript_00081.p1  ORF type:complete len:2336 (+),score=350.42 Phypoly_transcript_00081:123-7130(+)